MKPPVAIRVDLDKPLTLEDLMPDDRMSLYGTINTRIYAGGSRLDEGWRYRWDGITRKIPPCVPHKNKGRNLQTVTVIVNPQDRRTVETIFAYYTGHMVEYGIYVEEDAQCTKT